MTTAREIGTFSLLKVFLIVLKRLQAPIHSYSKILCSPHFREIISFQHFQQIIKREKLKGPVIFDRLEGVSKDFICVAIKFT